MKYPEAVFNGGKASSSPRVYANGQLVLWSMAENTPVTINDLSNSLIEHIALANPKTAPYGLAAVEGSAALMTHTVNTSTNSRLRKFDRLNLVMN